MESRLGNKRLSRRSILAGLAAAAVASVLTACGQQTTPSAPAPTSAPAKSTAAASSAVSTTIPATPTSAPGVTGLPAPKSGQTVIQYWHNFGAGVSADVHTEQIMAFLNANSKYAVDAQYVPTTQGTQLSDKLIASISGGNPPDAARFDRFIVTSWAARGFLTDVSDRAKADGVTQDKFILEGWMEATYKGKVYGVPFDTDMRALYYNKKLMEQGGLDPNKPPTTMEELDAMSDKLTKKDGNKYTQMGLIPWQGQGGLYTWAFVFGGEPYDKAKDVVTMDHPQIVKALEWTCGYSTKYNVDSMDMFASSFGTNAQDPFVAQYVAFMAGGDWQIATNLKYMKPELKDAWDWVPYPKAQGGPAKVTWGGGWSTIIPKGSKQADGGWALAKYLGTDAASIYAIKTTHMPIYLPAYDDLEKNKAQFDPRWVKFWPLREVCRFRPNLPVGQELGNGMSTALDLARHGKETPQAVLTRLSKDVNDLYAKSKG